MKIQENHFIKLDYFLGTTTALGFKSYFEALRTESDMSIILWKNVLGLDGTGVLEKIALQQRATVAYIHNPQDATQLVGAVFSHTKADGDCTNNLPKEPQTIQAKKQTISEKVKIMQEALPLINASGDDAPTLQVQPAASPSISVAILDATTPHQMELAMPGLQEHVVDLYSILDIAQLQRHAKEVAELLAQSVCLQVRAARYMASVGGLLFDSYRAVSCIADKEKAKQYAQNICKKMLPPLGKEGSEKRRFLSAITATGSVCYTATISALANRIVVFEDEYGAASRAILETIQQEAIARGYDIITCPCALFPEEKIDHIIIPSLGLAFVTSNTWHPMLFAGQKNVHCTRFVKTESLKNCRTRLRFNTKAAKEVLKQCSEVLAQLAACRLAIRALYRPAMDSAQIEAKTNQVLQMMQQVREV